MSATAIRASEHMPENTGLQKAQEDQEKKGACFMREGCTVLNLGGTKGAELMVQWNLEGDRRQEFKWKG